MSELVETRLRASLATKELVREAAERLGFRLVRVPAGSPSDPEAFVEPCFELVLGDYLLRRRSEQPFFFVQVGALDGITDDPLHDHVERLGWEGLVVEPQPRYFAALCETYRGHPGVRPVQAVIAHERGTATLYTVGDADAGDLPDWAAGLASLSRETLERHEVFLPGLARRIEETAVEAITFDDLLARAPRGTIDLVQIDVEGFDVEILSMIDLARLAPPLVRFEHRHLSRAEYRRAVALLRDAGYRIFPERWDTCAYRRPEAGDDARA